MAAASVLSLKHTAVDQNGLGVRKVQFMTGTGNTQVAAMVSDLHTSRFQDE